MDSKTNRSFTNFFQTMILFGVVLIISQLLLTYIVGNDVVNGPSMEPTLYNGQRLLSAKMFKPKRNDIVVLKAPDRPGDLYIKRVIGMPGDTVESKNDQLYINGKRVDQPYLSKEKEEKGLEQFNNVSGQNQSQYTIDFTLENLLHEKRVPEGEYLVMGDNRPVSHDGRSFGFVKRSSLIGKVFVRYWPINKFRLY
ncbi:signal peptidase I [Xylocopilactobacillus apicola]|uniref:Signal peptidase I n=1 Tax=Xylocopilactobacillus apicola TaxID=2932184 RepID=A0AAU9D9E7_9LACO|nr:signal peptidase I [Xylocopilactobacillus apicola]BDR58105.1 signal peptidase I [Xylocopilactobacillus apicola]